MTGKVNEVNKTPWGWLQWLTIWVRHKTGKNKTKINRKTKTWDYLRVARAYKTNISVFKFWTKINMCLNEANWHLHSPENVIVLSVFLLLQNTWSFSHYFGDLRHPKQAYFWQAITRADGKIPTLPQVECLHFVLLETSLAMGKIILLKKLSAFSIAPPFPES